MCCERIHGRVCDIGPVMTLEAAKRMAEKVDIREIQEKRKRGEAPVSPRLRFK